MRVTVRYPQFFLDTKEVDLTAEEVETLQNCTDSETAEIIGKYLTPEELQNVPVSIAAAVDYDYAAIIFNRR